MLERVRFSINQAIEADADNDQALKSKRSIKAMELALGVHKNSAYNNLDQKVIFISNFSFSNAEMSFWNKKSTYQRYLNIL